MADFPERIEAPNWLADDRLLYNAEGRLFTIEIATGRVAPVDTGSCVRCNNDHVVSRDGRTLGISCAGVQGHSQVYVLPLSGGEPRLVTEKAPSYLHGISPDGRRLAYCASRDGEFDVYDIAVSGGEERRLTTAPGLDDGPEYTPDGKYICHFPEDNTIWSINSGYGGNVLLGKKCFALRIASYLGRKEGWMAEHMLILGIETPEGELKYISAAFPSACGKTNLAMLIPPEIYKKKGYKVWCVGDDIAWLRVGEDGRLWAVNPENGFFGVAPGTNSKSNPNALATTQRDTIFTNVVHDLDNNTVWWEGLNDNPPSNAIDWRGNKWDISMYNKNDKSTCGAHPNSRFTAKATNCPCLSSEFNNPKGVPISAIVFGGRRAKTAPLVYQSTSWQNGTFVGSIMASETTAAASGAVGVVRRDPMAMRPFTGYDMGDYFGHWLEMGKNIPNPPKIFHVNWFRTDADGHFIWPGFGDNMRVLLWILARCEGKVDARETAIGYVPYAKDINIEGLDITEDTVNELLSVDNEAWLADVENIKEFYDMIGGTVPCELREELSALKARLSK